jgi:hypothetical protein
MLSSGLSLIPVRDKPQGDRPAKTPYQGWKKHQSEIITLATLWGEMEHYNTEAVAIICGAVSGNLEIIDIDVKYKPGIDAVLLTDIRSLYPALFSRLRIHKTPSGGYHILYRIAPGGNSVPGNEKLAGRPATAEELALRPKSKTYNFLETRGEGGYAVAPPSMGYGIHQDNTIPTITWEERCSIIHLCKSYTEIAPVAAYKPTVADTSYYDENPFAHFNASAAAETVLTDNGWKEFGHNNTFIWFTRPDKDTGVSASFNRAKRVYYIFTSSTEFDEGRGYQPATALSILAHGGDKKKTFRYLVQSGYGIIKPSIEAGIVRKKAGTGRPLPPNASQTARAEYDTTRAIIQSTYPYGIFWTYNEESELIINRERLYQVAEGLGFRVHNNEAVRLDGYQIHEQTERQFFDGMKAYIKEEDADEYEKICNVFEPFIQRNGAFTITRLPLLDTATIVRDTSTASYKFYQNGYLFITAEQSQFNTYDTLSGLIWSKDILQRQYNPGEPGGRFLDFLACAVGDSAYTRKIIGYLAHQYKDETTGYIIVLTESCPDPRQGGGSGKNIFSSSFQQTTSYKSIPGSQVKYDEKFMNAWGGERIFAVSDVPKKFDFSFLKELSTGSGILKKLFKDEVAVPVTDMPKFIIQSNFSFDTSDGGLKRRIIPLEFGDFFTKAGGVDVHFGIHFPNGWTLEDWTGYDNLVADCIQLWLAGGLKLHPVELTQGGWEKQFEQLFGPTAAAIIEEYHQTWWEQEWVKSDDFKNYINTWCTENNTPINFRPSLQKINEALTKWAKHHNKQFLPNHSKRENNITVKYKWFGNQLDTPF